QYEVYVVCKYIASDMDFESVDIKSFFPALEISDVYLALINFRSKERYITEDIAGYNYFYFDGPKHYYSLSDVVTAYKEKGYISETKEYFYDDSVNYSYAHYASKIINGIEFTWDDCAYALEFEVVPAEKEIQTTDYSEETFYSTKEEAISITCSLLLKDTYDINNSIYCYFDKALKNSEMLVAQNYGKDTYYSSWTIDSKKDSYNRLDILDEKALFILGFYESK
ncbi:MAG: hypothetical protein QM644_15625, partial [Mobilitalea sp.]